MSGPSDGFSASAASINGSSHLLMEMAGLLYQGRMDGGNAMSCRVPRAHADVAERAETFARFAKDQYEDMVALLAALSTKLSSAGNGYAQVDHLTETKFDQLLRSGELIAAEDR